MEQLELIAVHRARSALELAFAAGSGKRPSPRDFPKVIKAFALNGDSDSFETSLAGASPTVQAFVQKASAATVSTAFGTDAGEDLSRTWLESLAPRSLLESLIEMSAVFPWLSRPARALTAMDAGIVGEGAAKLVADLDLLSAEFTGRKIAAIVALTNETLRFGGEQAIDLIDRELSKALIRTGNAAILDLLPPTATIAGSADIRAALAEGIAAAGPSDSYLVAATRAACAELALQSDGRMRIDGGEPVPGVRVVVVDFGDTAAPRLSVITASRIGIKVQPLRLDRSDTAALAFDSGSPDALTSMFSANSTAILAEREFAIAASQAIIVEVQ